MEGLFIIIVVICVLWYAEKQRSRDFDYMNPNRGISKEDAIERIMSEQRQKENLKRRKEIEDIIAKAKQPKK